MRRTTSRATGDRVGAAIIRATVEKTNDDPRMREVDLNLMHGEKGTEIEHPEPYGFSARVKDPTTEGGKKRRAEAFVVRAAGNSSHPFAAVISDRRYRPKDLQKGEVTLHDDQGQRVHLKRDGVYVYGLKVTFQVRDGQGNLKAKIELVGDDIVLTPSGGGKIKLGGADAAKPASMEGTLDSAGHAEVSNLATKVLVK